MKVKMLSSVITSNLINLQHNGVYQLEDSLCEKLINSNYAILVQDEEEKQEEKQTKPKRTKRTSKKEV